MATLGNPDGTPQAHPEVPPPSPRGSRRRRAAILIAAAVLAALVTGGIVAALTIPGTTTSDVLSGRSGGKAPAFSLSVVSQPNGTVSSSQFSGEDLVLNFWASWCFPCQQEMPTLQAASLRLHGKVRFVGIDTNDTRSAALGFLGRVHVSYVTLFDPHGDVAGSYGLFGLPTTVFVSRTGIVLGRHSGQLDAASLQSALTQAFGASATS
jgi:thiol-disulfide isomerase/thioredoxin